MGADATDTRSRVAERVASAPGLHFRGLVRDLDLAPGQVQYHLRRLTDEGDLVTEEVGGRTHYFPAGTPRQRRRAVATLRRETARDVVAILVERGPMAPAAVTSDLDVARSTLEWHLTRLTDAGLVDKRYDEAGHVTLVVPEPERAGEALAAIAPSLPERLVDRFTRLVDSLFAE